MECFSFDMNLSSFLPWKRKSASSETLKQLLGSGSTSASGVKVDWKKAVQLSTFFACARVISEGIAQVPFKVSQKRKGGLGSDLATDHHLYHLLSLRPNEWQTSYEFREQIGLHLAIKFNAYIFKVRGLGGKIVELLPFEPDKVRIIRDGWERRYEVSTEKGQVIKVSSEDMWHIRGPSWDGVVGLDVIKLAREAIGMALAAEEHGARLFGNGTKLSGILTTDATSMTAEQRADLRSSWEEMHSGSLNAYRTAVLFGGLKYQSMGMTGVDAQHLEQRRFQVEEVCRGMRVMPIMIGHSDKVATYASAEQMFLAHVVHTMMPWYTRLEQSAAINLLSDEEIKAGYFMKFNVNGLMRGSMKDRADYFTKMFNIGSLNPNEIRDLEDLNPYEGGDEYRVPMNTEQPGDNSSDQDQNNRGNEYGNPAP